MINDKSKFRLGLGGGEALIYHLSFVIGGAKELILARPGLFHVFLCWLGIQWLIHSEVVDMVLLVVDRIFVLFGHHQTKGRAREGAKRAVAALRHVNIENISAQ